MSTASTTARPRRGLVPRVVTVNLPPPAPLLRVWVAGNAPSVNHMYVARHLTPEARAWRDAVATSLLPWRFSERVARPNLAVSFIWIGMRSDIDNPCKLTLDGVKEGLLVDDKYVSRLTIEKRPLERGGERGAWIEVTCLPQTQKQPRATRNKRTV